ncbi:MAG: thymidylate synthase [Clostridia bacterium]|nr:thymidylate synthase [Clostridia bacterium]
MRVELISYTPDPERLVAAAARLCYSSRSAGQIMENFTPGEIQKLLETLLAMGHESPAEHVSFTFAVEGVSRVLSHQLVRHRIASYSQKSQRYVSEKNFTYVTPPSLREHPEALKAYQDKIEEIRRLYRDLQALIPAEDARYILPEAVTTNIICTFNARSLFNFFRLRCCRRAQWEIRELAEKMRTEVRKVAPNLFARAGPSCETEGICYEGKYTCGRAKEIRRREGV